MSEQTAGLVEAAEAEPVSDAEETTVSEAEETEQQSAVDQETDNSDDTDAEEESDSLVLDLGGNKLELAKDSNLADVLEQVEGYGKGLQADYTRKTQEHAERVKSLEAREKSLEKLSTINTDVLNVYAKASHLKAEIDQFQNLDMNALWQSDPDQARRLSDLRSSKQSEFSQALAELNRKEQELTRAQETERNRRKEEGKALIEKQVKGFNADEVVSYAIKEGIPEQDAKDWALTPQLAVWAWKAAQFDKMQAKAKQPAPKQQKPAQPVTPMKAAGKAGGRPFDPVRDADKLPADEWFKKERARMAKLNG